MPPHVEHKHTTLPALAVVERNGYVLDGGCGLAICEALEAFPDTVRRKFNGGLPESLFRVSRDHLSKRLNVVLMDANEAVTIKGEDILAGAQRLRQTMGLGVGGVVTFAL